MSDPIATRTVEQTVLAAFEAAKPGEPLTSAEVAAAAGCTRRTAYNWLQSLEARGMLKTKKVGAHARVWWRDVTTSGEQRVAELQFTSELLAEPYTELGLSDREVYFDVTQEFQLPDGRWMQYYTVLGITPKEFTAVFDSYPTVESVRLLSTTGGVSRMETLVERSSVSEVLRRYGGGLRSVSVRDGVHWLTAELPLAVDVGTVEREVGELYTDLTLQSTRWVPRGTDFWSVVAADLTERQQTVLRLAYHSGYFESPRQSTGDDLADRLDITRQTLNHHLRQGQNAVFRWLFEGDAVVAPDV